MSIDFSVPAIQSHEGMTRKQIRTAFTTLSCLAVVCAATLCGSLRAMEKSQPAITIAVPETPRVIHKAPRLIVKFG